VTSLAAQVECQRDSGRSFGLDVCAEFARMPRVHWPLVAATGGFVQDVGKAHAVQVAGAGSSEHDRKLTALAYKYLGRKDISVSTTLS
jgi:hypothetical protein